LFFVFTALCFLYKTGAVQYWSNAYPSKGWGTAKRATLHKTQKPQHTFLFFSGTFFSFVFLYLERKGKGKK